MRIAGPAAAEVVMDEGADALVADLANRVWRIDGRQGLLVDDCGGVRTYEE